MKNLSIKIKGLIIFSLILFIAISCKKTSNTNFSVEGKLDNLSNSSIYAVKKISKDSMVIDTIPVDNNGKFKYSGFVESQALVSLFTEEGVKPITFFLEPDYKVEIKGDALESDLVETRGGRVNDDLTDFKVKNNNILQSRYRILGKHENMDISELKNVNFQLARCVRDYVENNPAKIASVILMNEFSINNISVELLGNDIELLEGEATNFYLTTSLKEYYDKIKISMVGSIAPDFTLKNTRGKTVKLSDFKAKDVLLIFALKDSQSNVGFFNQLKEIQQKLKGKMEFLIIVIDENVESPDQKLVDITDSLKWNILLDHKKWNSQVVKEYNVTQVPYSILISSDGQIQERDISLDGLIERYKE